MNPPRKPAPGKPAAKPTGRAAAKPTTGRAAPPPASRRSTAPAKNPMPLYLGIGGGVLLLIGVLAVVFMSGGEAPEKKAGKTATPKADAGKKAPPPDVSGLEATGKSKCDQAQNLINPRLTPDSSAPKDRVRNDLEAGLKLLNDGIAAYEKAAQLAGKKYPIDEYKKLRDKAIRLFCTELEAEAQKACDQGRAAIMGAKDKIVDTDKLSDDERSALYVELKKAQDLIRGGMELFSRSEAVSGHQFDTTPYQEALKVIRAKMPELKPK